ncbi:DNA helicase [Saccharibacillus sp. O23]|uniref:3'-5' exonuclease n=1 Tax=Saccharibacillus sp. O23 TaxID=2009338 RepID=UPI000B4E77F1|nr:3'-5' exonuclease [Saccharibacillus sp. O23]OWR33153.1 DNA helicase [Saccharibacillus sp. O23]
MAKKIVYSNEQKEIIKYEGSQLLIRGIAGSGKTLMLLEKACDVATKNPNDSIAIFTYGKPLSIFLESQIREKKLDNIIINTFHSWALRNYYLTFEKRPQIEQKRRHKLEEAIKLIAENNKGHRFVDNKHLIEFIETEIGWIKGCDLCEFKDYDKAPRKGRGGKVRLSAIDKKVMFQIFEKYQELLGSKLDYHDVGLLMSRNLDKIKEKSKFDHIFIDEAQDLTKVNITTLCHIARKSCIVGADKGQKIFTTSFTWESVGLNIKGGRTKVLRQSYRSTKQIMELAYSIQEKDEISKDEEFTRPALPSKNGAKPKIFFTKNVEAHDKVLIETVKLITQFDPKATIGVLSRYNKKQRRIERLFKDFEIGYKVINSSNESDNTNIHSEPGIKLTTLHTAKGLEFKYVIIANAIDPASGERLGDDFDWDIERRLIYVGMSRAMEVLTVLTYGDRHFLVDELNKSCYDPVVV